MGKRHVYPNKRTVAKRQDQLCINECSGVGQELKGPKGSFAPPRSSRYTPGSPLVALSSLRHASFIQDTESRELRTAAFDIQLCDGMKKAYGFE
jgi:hypothetical protein